MNQNPYNGINAVLGQLGFSGQLNDPVLHHAAHDLHYNHFHIDLRAPERVGLPQNLLTGDAATTQVADNAHLANAQAWLDQVKADLNLTQGEVTMFIPDMPNIPPQNMPVMIAQANQAQAGDTAKIRTIGVCSPSPNHNYSSENGLAPLTSAGFYLEQFEKRSPPASAVTAILQPPQHGVLRLVTEADRGVLFDSEAGPLKPSAQLYAYLPDSSYVGNDTAIIEVDYGNGLKVNVKYFFQAISEGLGDDWMRDYCSKTGVFWKISSTLDANGNNTITSVEYQSPTTSDTGTTATDTAALASTLGTTLLSNLAGKTTGVTVNLADLPGAAVGQTTGSNITLDTNAAGYNWFIDNTPWDNSEFLPTSNPNEWVAKAGSEAAGKMDMLSVLLHEYGHALGIDHSADPNDYMGATLTAGVRRLPSAEELTLMQQLVAQAKDAMTATSSTPIDAPTFPTLPLGTSFIGFLGLLRSSRYGGIGIAPDLSTLVTQYDWAANPTLVNGSLNAADGWSTLGGVEFNPTSTSSGQASTGSGRTDGGATLKEVSNSQTRLSQVFLLNPSDRFLSFTLAGTALDDLTGAPDDAFEVALLDANTGASLLGNDGLTRTDAFLNLQGDGTQNAANCVTCIHNADGSRTYRVDLSGVAAGPSTGLRTGVAANLSFDLIGFGQNGPVLSGVEGSHVTVRDVRLSGLPQLHDDTAALQEDGTLAFDPFAQVDNAAVLQLGSHVVDQPAHGAVTVNADGTFSYTPEANYNGTDTFTYDGPLESNLATVSLSIAAVNDAPVVADVQASTAEDTAVVIALGAYASDVDSTTLTTQIVTDGTTSHLTSPAQNAGQVIGYGPTHGTLTQNADGSASPTRYWR